jgi:H+/Cl- antiporter ClcA
MASRSPRCCTSVLHVPVHCHVQYIAPWALGIQGRLVQYVSVRILNAVQRPPGARPTVVGPLLLGKLTHAVSLPPPPPDCEQIFNISTVVVKFLSAGLAVASGLPVGPEGPLIHIGAAMGMALSQAHSTSLG